jgi:hypothetical protein
MVVRDGHLPSEPDVRRHRSKRLPGAEELLHVSLRGRRSGLHLPAGDLLADELLLVSELRSRRGKRLHRQDGGLCLRRHLLQLRRDVAVQEHHTAGPVSDRSAQRRQRLLRPNQHLRVRQHDLRVRRGDLVVLVTVRARRRRSSR